MKFLSSTLALLAIITNFSAGWKDSLMIMIQTYRQISLAPALIWDDNLVPSALSQSINCSLIYDYFADNGQIIFNVAQIGEGVLDLGKASVFAADHWYDLRHQYKPTQDDYDELEPFYNSWEFSAMVWKDSQRIGCAWSTVLCPTGDKEAPSSTQLVCLLNPPPNRWDQFGANVHCIDCGNEQQISTIDPATITWDTQAERAIDPAKKESISQPTNIVKREVKAAEKAQQAHGDATPENLEWWKSQADALRAKHGLAKLD